MQPLQPTFFQTYPFGEGVTAFTTLRTGGVSEGNYASFNINPYCGDNPLHVAENRRRLCTALQLPEGRLVLPHQTHGRRVRLIDEYFFALTDAERARYLEDTDGLIASCHCCIGVSTADCVPLLFYDEANRAAAAVHAGWRGTVARIAVEAVERMKEHFATHPAQLKVCIGPSISQKAFEVGDEVYDAFAAEGFPMKRLTVRTDGSWHIDLWEANRLQLEAAGVPASRIFVCGQCTYSLPDRYFSARRSGIRSGRLYSGVLLTSELFNNQHA